ncbi:hypothetical protein Clacol_003454 [Clathrus columnatus]|uniref:Acyl-CoA thioesterase-like N-terminal HotDog domain-containing protein n=1 Tax=Clathrus columnatus TaxID=1419009 RepID=A0AAV5A6E5_9AGAM|nr:hypothetical protein Clacol_003454 [Clathrus columnatus]
MAPLVKALQVKFLRKDGEKHIYGGDSVDKDWSIIAIPQGGYTVGLVVEAALALQRHTLHKNIVHVSTHFLRVVTLDPFEVHIQVKFSAKNNTILAAELIQKDKTKLMSHLIFKASPINSNPELTLLPPSPLARQIPLRIHPSAMSLKPIRGVRHHELAHWAEDPSFAESNLAKFKARAPGGEGVIEWGAWVQFIDPSEYIKESTLPFLADTVQNLPVLLPEAMGRLNVGWCPTMVLSVEYKSKLLNDDSISKRTVGIYARSTFMHEGRHDVYAEVWTAPCNVGEGIEVEDWREKQVCLAIGQQVALTLPPGVNERKGREAKL